MSDFYALVKAAQERGLLRWKLNTPAMPWSTFGSKYVHPLKCKQTTKSWFITIGSSEGVKAGGSCLCLQFALVVPISYHCYWEVPLYLKVIPTLGCRQLNPAQYNRQSTDVKARTNNQANNQSSKLSLSYRDHMMTDCRITPRQGPHILLDFNPGERTDPSWANSQGWSHGCSLKWGSTVHPLSTDFAL